MDSVQFDEVIEQERSAMILKSSQKSILVKLKIAKNDKQASKILLVFLCIFSFSAAGLIMYSLYTFFPKQIPYSQLPENIKEKLPLSAQEILEQRQNENK